MTKTAFKEIRLKFLFEKRMGGAWGNEPEGDNSVVCIRAADFETDTLSHSQDDLTRRSFTEDEIEKKGLKKGDIIIEKSGGGEHQPVGRVVLFNLDEPALCSNFLEVLRPNAGKVHSEFIAYLLYNLWVNRGVIPAIKQTTGIQNLDISYYLDTKIKLPEVTQQQLIITHLKNELSHIDTLIQAKENLLKLLAEKKQALITRAVTKGINPNAPMKDSGIDWLGEIPEHWEVVQLKYSGNITYGLSQPPEYLDDGLPLIRATNVKRGKIDKEGLVYIDESDIPSSKKVVLDEGDIIVVRSGAYTGDSALVTKEWTGSIAGFDMIFRAKENINSNFLSYALLSQYILENQLLPMRSRAAQPHLNAEELGSVNFVFPDIKEQEQIIIYVDKELSKINHLMGATQKSIDLLKERRAALIAAAVTGEIDVN